MSAARSLIDVLSLAPNASAGHLVTLDLESAGVNLASVPLDEVLDFKSQHGTEYRAYARDLRVEVQTLATMDPADRIAQLLDRQEMLSDLSNDLGKSARRSFGRQLASFVLGIAGAAWNLLGQHDPVGAVLAASSAAAGAGQEAAPVTAYSYVFSAVGSFAGRSKRSG